VSLSATILFLRPKQSSTIVQPLTVLSRLFPSAFVTIQGKMTTSSPTEMLCWEAVVTLSVVRLWDKDGKSPRKPAGINRLRDRVFLARQESGVDTHIGDGRTCPRQGGFVWTQSPGRIDLSQAAINDRLSAIPPQTAYLEYRGGHRGVLPPCNDARPV
jgi:hypothetical protein